MSRPFSRDEVKKVISSLKNVTDGEGFAGIEDVVAECAHLPHTDWNTTEVNSEKLAEKLGGVEEPKFRRAFEWILEGGGWDAAAAVASSRDSDFKPWIVLVIGLNGIRKSTSVYQDWFQDVLKLALGESYSGTVSELPGRGNSFFRQLDYMVATVANVDFRELYSIESLEHYSEKKAAVFSRHRTLAEMLGIHLLKEAQARRMNVMLETSGKDVGMFKYIDHFFSSDKYRKLVVHFDINDIQYAEESVDSRMTREIESGRKAISSKDSSALDIIRANAGGPYGSSVLKGVKMAADKVWNDIATGAENVGKLWYKANLLVSGSKDEDWTVTAMSPEGELLGKAHKFVKKAT